MKLGLSETHDGEDMVMVRALQGILTEAAENRQGLPIRG